jgi:hypothetical protein
MVLIWYAIIIIVLILLIVFLFKLRNSSPNEEFVKTSAFQFDKHAKHVLTQTFNRPTRNAQDEYMLATVLEHNLHLPTLARPHYIRAVERVAENPPNDFHFILDRAEEAIERMNQPIIPPEAIPPPIEDIRNLIPPEELVHLIFAEQLPELDIGLIPFNPMHIRAIRLGAQHNVQTDVAKDKRLEQQIKWHSDPQNVHDTHVNQDLTTMYNKLRTLNNHTRLEHAMSKQAMREYLYTLMETKATPEQRLKVAQVLDTLFDYNGTIFGVKDELGNPVEELDILGEVICRITSPDNAERRGELEISLVSALEDCMENNHVVCGNGRISRILTSLAHLDVDPTIGVVKSKEVIRNACFELAAKIRDRHINTDELREKYNKDTIPEVVDIIKTDINTEIRKEFASELTEQELANIIADAQEAI